MSIENQIIRSWNLYEKSIEGKVAALLRKEKAAYEQKRKMTMRSLSKHVDGKYPVLSKAPGMKSLQQVRIFENFDGIVRRAISKI